MKVITEDILRREFKYSIPGEYIVPSGTILTPAAREYLRGLEIKIIAQQEYSFEQKEERALQDSIQGALKKREHMTVLTRGTLVAKNHKRIVFRGAVDLLQAKIVEVQAELYEKKENIRLVEDLCQILSCLTEIMRCEVLEVKYEEQKILNMTKDEIRRRSHNPQNYYNVKKMELPCYKKGRAYALLNLLRAEVRRVEVLAVDAFSQEVFREDVIRELNRLSSALHVMACMYLSGEYN